MNWTSTRTSFYYWIDAALSQAIPENTEAFHFNLYEGRDSVHVQLVGNETFDPGDSPGTYYWPGAETFSTGEAIFEVPFSVAGDDWQAWLSTLTQWIDDYIANGSMSSVLRSRQGVGLGFVDGDMYVRWRRD
ncbi:hypothetical protein [Stenotrophomonas sp. PS02289]|uniref:hypothetical protein n=1 Tax=Stenotrophomonas sp. PS02289 TaxID=2991422 RepID=UPI00249A2D3C|nr:hypothetical protein [Stenotrophomonas sp. PS02289]